MSKNCTGFLGRWRLIPESCEYGQGDPPKEGSYEFWEKDGALHFRTVLTDASGESHTAQFGGIPDGSEQPFSGGELADSLSITAVSERDLRSSAYYRGNERMVVQHQLDATSQAMRVTQIVRFPDGNQLANVAVYQKDMLH